MRIRATTAACLAAAASLSLFTSCAEPVFAGREEAGLDPGLPGSPVTLDVQNIPLEDVLSEIEQQTGNAIRLENARADALRSRRISLSVSEAPFWEVVGLIEEKTGLRFKELDERTLFLDPEGTSPHDDDQLVAEPAVRGIFRLKPAIPENLDDIFRVLIETEPKYLWPAIDEYTYLIETREGERFRYATTSGFSRFSTITGRFTPRLEINELEPVDRQAAEALKEASEPSRPWDDNPLLADLQTVAKLEFRARVRVPLEWDNVTLPPLVTIAAKPIGLDGALVRIPVVETIEPEDGTPELRVQLRIRGARVQAGDCRLIDAEGNRHNPHGGGSFQHHEGEKKLSLLTLQLDKRDIRGPLEKLDLVFGEEDGERQWTIADFLEHAATPQDIGDGTTVRVTSAEFQEKVAFQEDQSLVVKLHVDGFRFDPRAARLVHGDEVFKPLGYLASNDGCDLYFRADELPDNRLKLRLRLHVPTKSQAITLEHTWQDVRIRAEKSEDGSDDDEAAASSKEPDA